MKNNNSDLDNYTEEEIRQIAALAMEASGTIEADLSISTGEEGVTESGVLSLTRNWEDYWWSPLRFKNGKIKIWGNGDWEYYCLVDNESRHSDWDVWVTLRVKSRFNNQIIHTFANKVGEIDIDHHDDPQEMKASGNSSFIQRNFERFRDFDYRFNRKHTRDRDN